MLKNFDTNQRNHNALIKRSIGLLCLLTINCCTHNIAPQSSIAMLDNIITNKKQAQINIPFTYSILVSAVASTTNSSGTVTQVDGQAVLSTGGTIDGTASINSTNVISYAPGHTVEYLFAARFSAGVSGSSQWIGALTTTYGFAVGYNDTTFSILYRNAISGSLASNMIAQSDFNIDHLDGTDSSSFTLDPTKQNAFKISFDWQDDYIVTFWIMLKDSSWRAFHAIRIPNNLVSPSVNIPQLPLRAEVVSSGTTNNITLYTANWMGSIIGINDTNYSNVYATEILGVTNVTTEAPLLTIKNKCAYPSKSNYLNLRILFANVGSQTPGGFTVFRLIKNANLTGANFSDYATDLSVVQIDTTAHECKNGIKILSIFNTNDSSANLSFINNGIPIVLLPNDTLTITGCATSTATLNASLCWQEPIA